MKVILCSVWFLISVQFSINAQPAQRIPLFKFYGKNNQDFVNNDLAKGRKLFFVFFDSECEHCQHVVQHLNLQQKKLENVYLYLITLDSPEKAEKFLAKYGNNLLLKPNVKLLFDRNYEFINKFKPKKYPSLFLYSSKGNLILYTDDEGKMEFVFKKINEK